MMTSRMDVQFAILSIGSMIMMVAIIAVAFTIGRMVGRGDEQRGGAR